MKLSDITGLKLGSSDVQKVYQGGSVVWESTSYGETTSKLVSLFNFAAYPLSGANLSDISGNDRTMTAVGTPITTAPLDDDENLQATDFASDSYAYRDEAFNIGGKWELTWLFLRTSAAGAKRLFHAFDSGGNSLFRLMTEPNSPFNKLRLLINGANGASIIDQTAVSGAVADNNPHMISLKHDDEAGANGTIYVYVDNVLVMTAVLASSLQANFVMTGYTVASDRVTAHANATYQLLGIKDDGFLTDQQRTDFYNSLTFAA